MKFQFQLHPTLFRGLDLYAVLNDVCRQWPEFKSDRFHVITVDNSEPDDRSFKINLMVDDDGRGNIAVATDEPFDTEPFDDAAWLSGFVREGGDHPCPKE